MASIDLRTEVLEALAEIMGAGARPTFFISAKWCGNACASIAYSELNSSLAPSANRNANALFLKSVFLRLHSVIAPHWSVGIN